MKYYKVPKNLDGRAVLKKGLGNALSDNRLIGAM